MLYLSCSPISVLCCNAYPILSLTTKTKTYGAKKYNIMYCKQKHLEQKKMYNLQRGQAIVIKIFFLLEAWLMSRKFLGIAFSVFVSCFFLGMHFRPIVAVLFVNFSTTVCRHLPVFNCTIQMSSGFFRIWVRICHVHCLKKQPEFDLKSQVWFQTKTAQHEVQLPLYYIHFTYNLICYYKQDLKCVWLCCFSDPFSLAGKKMQFRANW